MSKQYGLILPSKEDKKVGPVFKATKNVFGDDSDTDEETNRRKPSLRPSDNTKRQAKKVQEKAMIEDPTVYQYDELYDDMAVKKKEVISASKEEKRPQYIEKLMEAANKRKRENERRIERQVQKEREKEGDEFADKESFVTSAYKKKLEELRMEEEKEKREEYLEDIGDVKKQSDLGGFYRHLYEQKLGPNDKEKVKQKIPSDKESINKDEQVVKKEVDDPKENKSSKGEQTEKIISSIKKGRNYRKRKSSMDLANKSLSEGEVLSEEEVNRVSLEDIKSGKKPRHHIESNIDADSDFSIDSSDEEESSKKPKNVQTIAENLKLEPTKPTGETVVEPAEETKSSNSVKLKPDDDIESKPKPKVNIWAKRTVGVVLEQALKRYYERKAARSR